jgi:uncharacterized protein YbjT (DUF2867 family)
VARALIVGCGCRGRSLAAALAEEGWQVRGTSRRPEGLGPIEDAGVEAALADPDRPGTLLDLVGDVAVVHWLLGSAVGDPEQLEAIHGPRLERVLERLVDTPVRGFVYEAAGGAPKELLRGGRALVEAAASRWRIPASVVMAEPVDTERWLAAMVAATGGALRGPANEYG